MILAIKTPIDHAEIYLLRTDGTVIGQKIWLAGRELSKQLLSEIDKLLRWNKVDFKELAGLIVFKGPGSFTSLRIGITVANTLAYSLEIPIVGTTSKNWRQDGVEQLRPAALGYYVIPEYGAKPNISRPKK